MAKIKEGSIHEENWNVNQRRGCQALNAAMRGVAKTLFNAKEDVEIYGFLERL